MQHFGTSTALHHRMAVSVGTELGAGTGLGSGLGTIAGAGLGAGLAAGAPLETDLGTSFGQVIAALGNGGTSGQSDGAVAWASGKGTRETWSHATPSSESPGVGRDGFKVNWQSMLRASGVARQQNGETTEAIVVESVHANATDGIGGGRGARSAAAAAFVDRNAAQPTPAAGGGNGSTEAPAVVVKSSTRGKQPEAFVGNGAADARGETAWDETKRASSIENSPTGSKSGQEKSLPRNAEARGHAAHGADVTTASPADVSGFAAQTAAWQANIPMANLLSSEASGLREPVDDQGQGRAAAVASATAGAADASEQAFGMASTAAVSTIANSIGNASAAAQIPIRSPQMLPRSQARSSEATPGAESEGRGHDGDQEESAVFRQSTSSIEPSAANSESKAIGVMHSRSTSGPDDSKPAGGEFFTHRTAGAAGASALTSGTSESNNPGTETGGESAITPLAKTGREIASAADNSPFSQQHEPHLALGQASAIETPVTVRDQAGGHGLALSATAAGSSSLGTPAPQEPFAALDAGTTVGAPNWIHAGGRQAEAGFEDPALGWIGVRADLSGGGVHAALVPGSTEAAQALSGHLEGLSAYLSENRMPVATLTMFAPGNSSEQTAANQNMGQAMEQGAGQHGEQQQAASIEMESQPGAGATAPAGKFDAMAYARDGRGTHISVMA